MRNLRASVGHGVFVTVLPVIYPTDYWLKNLKERITAKTLINSLSDELQARAVDPAVNNSCILRFLAEPKVLRAVPMRISLKII
jgi:hypothetical protein